MITLKSTTMIMTMRVEKWRKRRAKVRMDKEKKDPQVGSKMWRNWKKWRKLLRKRDKARRMKRMKSRRRDRAC